MAEVSSPRWPALALLAGALGGGIGVSLCACPTPSPSPAPTPEGGYERVYSELTEAGCLAAGPGVLNTLVAQDQTGHSSWIGCMLDSGSIASCNAPCERAGWVRRPDGAP